MSHLSERTREIYDRNAGAYDGLRNRALTERAWLLRALADVPDGGAVLDLGCGTGAPIGEWLLGQGVALTAVDFAPAMVEIARRRLPAAEVHLADMRALALARRFDAVIGWGSFFHLTPDEQRATLPRLVRHLNPGGRLLLTVGPGAGEVTGTVAGDTVYHASLSPEEYAAILAREGAPVEEFRPEDPDCTGHSLVVARRNH
ncbi:class I SAM-dependent methyltransferase [Salipiger sp.]|uniref:class I SAM-dependent methyltransferase n=1 Tax=Salipiger sp. TaxID=2078585 RepID=UPI003A984F79